MNLPRHSLLLPLSFVLLIVLAAHHCIYFVGGCVVLMMVQSYHRHGDVMMMMMSSSILLVEMQSTPADGDDSHSIPALEGHHCRLFDIDCSSAGRPLSAWAVNGISLKGQGRERSGSVEKLWRERRAVANVITTHARFSS